MNEILEQDDLESLEELRKILLKEQETPSFVGVFVSEPDSKEYPINATYKKGGVVYINTVSGWVKFVEDGAHGKNGVDGKTSIPGGGLGFNDVVKTIKTTTIQSNYIDVGSGFTHSNSQNLDGLLHDFDSIISSGGGGSFTGTIDASAVNIPPDYINTSATSLDGVIADFDKIISGKVLFGEYKTNDVFEELYLYVGYAALDGRWYIKRVEEVGEDMYLRYANISNNPLVLTYTDAINNRASLAYDLIQNITV